VIDKQQAVVKEACWRQRERYLDCHALTGRSVARLGWKGVRGII